MKKLNLKPNKYSGKLIVFEGVDGSGKTTLLNLAANYLDQKKIANITLKMPSEFIKSHPVFHDFDDSLDDSTRNTVNLAHLTVFVSGDRLLTLDTKVIPALKQGLVVLCDRYCFTGYVRCTNSLIRKISNQFINPSLVIMPTADPETLKKRVQNRTNEKDNYYNEQNVVKQIKKFNIIAKKNKFLKINTEQEQKNINRQLYKELDNIINKI